jgi:hypothetical protein
VAVAAEEALLAVGAAVSRRRAEERPRAGVATRRRSDEAA